MIDASLVKQLRDKTGAGIMDCKKAISESAGNLEEAVKWLRTKGLAIAAKKSGRIAAEGLAAVAVEGKVGAIIEVNSETDFVARNEMFQNLVRDITVAALSSDNLESLKNTAMADGKSVVDKITESVGNIGENIHLRRSSIINVQEGVVSCYIHNSIAEGMGRIAVLVGLESSGDKTALEKLGKQIAMHIAAANPQALDEKEIDPKTIENEKTIFIEQSRNSGKPDNIIEKMVEGRIRKYVEEVTLLNQIFIMDNKSKIHEVLGNATKEIGAPITISKFVRFEVGEGIEQKEKNFADEVAAAAKR